MSQCGMCILGFLLYKSPFTQTVTGFTQGKKIANECKRASSTGKL